MVVHAFNLSTQEAEEGRSEFKANPVYTERESSRKARVAQRKPVLKKQ